MWSVIFDVAIVIVLVYHELPPCKTANLNDKCWVCAYSTNWSFPVFLPLLRPPYTLRHTTIEIRPINTITRASKFSSERKSHPSLTWNQKLKLIKVSEEGMSKAETGRKLGFLFQTVSQTVNTRKSYWGKLKVLL